MAHDNDFELCLQHAGQADLQLRLMPERTAFHAASSTLLAADLHLGKAAVFRARGIPVPQGTTTATLVRLSRALQRSQAQRLVVLGDLLHAKESHAADTLRAIDAWRARHPLLECWAVQGNHDRHAGVLPASHGFQTVDTYLHAQWLGVHDSADAAAHEGWRLAGHVHPAVRLRSKLDTLRLPCFWLRGRVLTLPAFGEFTGGHAVGIRRKANERFFVVAQTVTEI
jgi:uncharacterized protein